MKDEIRRLEFDKILAVNPLEKRTDISLLGPVLMIRPSLKTDPGLRFFDLREEYSGHIYAHPRLCP